MAVFGGAREQRPQHFQLIRVRLEMIWVGVAHVKMVAVVAAVLERDLRHVVVPEVF